MYVGLFSAQVIHNRLGRPHHTTIEQLCCAGRPTCWKSTRTRSRTGWCVRQVCLATSLVLWVPPRSSGRPPRLPAPRLGRFSRRGSLAFLSRVACLWEWSGSLHRSMLPSCSPRGHSLLRWPSATPLCSSRIPGLRSAVVWFSRAYLRRQGFRRICCTCSQAAPTSHENLLPIPGFPLSRSRDQWPPDVKLPGSLLHFSSECTWSWAAIPHS